MFFFFKLWTEAEAICAESSLKNFAEKERKSQNTREAARIKQRKNLFLGWESNPGPQCMRHHALTAELSRPSVSEMKSKVEY